MKPPRRITLDPRAIARKPPFLVLETIAIGVLANTVASAPSQRPRLSSPPYRLSDELSFAGDFVRFLEEAGMSVLEVGSSTWAGTFKDENDAAFVKTNRGVLEVVIFSGRTNAQKIRVTSHTDFSNEEAPRYIYKLGGLPTNGEAANVDSAFPVYFTTYKNWFIVTEACDLDRAIKTAVSKRATLKR